MISYSGASCHFAGIGFVLPLVGHVTQKKIIGRMLSKPWVNEDIGFVKVLPKIEETQSRVRKLEEKERLAEQEDRSVHI